MLDPQSLDLSPYTFVNFVNFVVLKLLKNFVRGGDPPRIVAFGWPGRFRKPPGAFWGPGRATFTIFHFLFQVFSALGPDLDPTLELLASRLRF